MSEKKESQSHAKGRSETKTHSEGESKSQGQSVGSCPDCANRLSSEQASKPGVPDEFFLQEKIVPAQAECESWTESISESITDSESIGIRPPGECVTYSYGESRSHTKGWTTGESQSASSSG